MQSPEQIFHSLIQLTGKEVEVGNSRSGAITRGVISYTMPDSFILETSGKQTIVRIQDLQFVRPVSVS